MNERRATTNILASALFIFFSLSIFPYLPRKRKFPPMPPVKWKRISKGLGVLKLKNESLFSTESSNLFIYFFSLATQPDYWEKLLRESSEAVQEPCGGGTEGHS